MLHTPSYYHGHQNVNLLGVCILVDIIVNKLHKTDQWPSNGAAIFWGKFLGINNFCPFHQYIYSHPQLRILSFVPREKNSAWRHGQTGDPREPLENRLHDVMDRQAISVIWRICFLYRIFEKFHSCPWRHALFFRLVLNYLQNLH